MKEAREVYLVDYVRTPFSLSNPLEPDTDVFSKKWGTELATHVLIDMFDNRIPNSGSTLKRENVSEVLTGSALLQHEHGTFGGRINIWMAKFPFHVPATVFDKQDCSGMATLQVGFGNISTGYSDVVVSLGFDQFTRVPLHTYGGKVKVFGWPPDRLMLNTESEWYNDDLYDWETSRLLFQSAQKLAEEEADNITKDETDKFSARSHNLAAKAREIGYFKEEIMPIKGHKSGDPENEMVIEEDQFIKNAITLEDITQMPSISTPGWAGGYKNPHYSKDAYVAKFGTEEGIITAGNSAPLCDGASLCLLASKDAVEEYKLNPMSKVVSIGFAAVDPTIRGRALVPAIQMALEHANLEVNDIDFWEINESFGVVVLNAVKKLGIDWENKLNIHGGAIAIGNPVSASGLRITSSLARILKEKKVKYGLAAISCGGGQGTAVVIENLNI